MEEIITNMTKPRKTMSVPEMRRLLGLGKTESYWLVKKKYFKTIVVGGKFRVLIESFENWYSQQLHYVKVDGPPPGEKWNEFTMSITETMELLGICNDTIYELMKRKSFVYYQVGNKRRIDKESFEKWYNSQTRHKKVNLSKGVIE